MSRRGDGEATFEAEGRTWRLRFDFNAMADFEAEAGKGAFDVLEAMQTGKAKATEIRLLFWATLREHHPEITIREAGRMIFAGMEAFHAAAASAMPAPEPGGEGESAGKTQAAASPAA